MVSEKLLGSKDPRFGNQLIRDVLRPGKVPGLS